MSEDEEPYNAGSAKQVRARGRKEAKLEAQATEDLKALLESPAGRRFLWRLLGKCGVWQTSFHPSGQQFAANEGRRGVGVELVTEIIETDPQAWIDLQQEQLTLERSAKL